MTTIENLPQDKKIILFDGVCNLCNSAVNFIIDRDRDDQFRFVSLQSELGQQLIDYLAIRERNIDSIILYEPGKAYYYKAQAVFKILNSVGGLYKLILLFRFLPNTLKDHIYDYVAKNRYKWYGKREACRIPTPEIQKKFL